jgi:transcriptional regulator with XRE-family HTH domain
MSQSELAAELGVTQQAVSCWLNGQRKPSPERIARIEELLGVPANGWDVIEEAASEASSRAPASGEHDLSPPSSSSLEREHAAHERVAKPTGT